MASLKMQVTANAKGFTLVELIVVITILAILGTIGFISLQGYSAQSRDSKRTSDLRSISTAISTKNTEGLSLVSMVTQDNARDLTTPSIGGAATTNGTNYTAGTPNNTVLGLNAENFKDPTKNVGYSVGVTTKVGGAFQVAATLDNGSSASITGNYTPRTAATYTATSNIATSSGNTITITNTAATGLIKRGDSLWVTGITTPAAYTVNTVSGDGLTITLSSNLVGIANATGVALGSTSTLANGNEAVGLIDSTSSGTGVTTNGTVVPY